MAVNRPAFPAITISWVLALIVLLFALAMIFLPAVVPFTHVTVGIGLLLLAGALLLPS